METQRDQQRCDPAVFTELPSTGCVTSPAGGLGASHTCFFPARTAGDQSSETESPGRHPDAKRIEAENPDTREHGPAGLCNWWAPNPNLSPPSGPSQKPVPRLCSSSWLHPLTLCVPLCSQLRAHPRCCVRPPSATHPRSLPRVCRPPPLVPAHCIILYMTPGCPRCSVPTAVFPSVYINPSKHSRARECSVYVSYPDCHTNGFYNYSNFVVDFQSFLFILYQIYLYIL